MVASRYVASQQFLLVNADLTSDFQATYGLTAYMPLCYLIA